MEKVYVNIDRYGNTSAASIPIALDEAIRAGRIGPGSTVLLFVRPANGIYLAAVNRVGIEGPPDDRIEFWGASFVAGPFGEIVAEASREQEETLITECDPKQLEQVRQSWPFFRDRRTDAYQEITKRWSD